MRDECPTPASRTLDLGPIEHGPGSWQDAGAQASDGPVACPDTDAPRPDAAAVKEAIMRHLIGIALAGLLLVGCAQLKSDAPYNAQEACEGSGGTFSSDGTCSAGRE